MTRQNRGRLRNLHLSRHPRLYERRRRPSQHLLGDP